MLARLRHLLSILQLTRIVLSLSVLSNSWLIIFLAYGLETSGSRNPVLNELHLAAALALGAFVSIGLHVYGVALNDVLDARHDRLFSPDRPIPAGRVGSAGAVIVAVLGLLAAVLAAAWLGHTSILLCVIAAIGILSFNTTGKFFPAAGIGVLAGIRVLHMIIPNPTLGFAWPIWLMMTHVLAVTALAHRLQNKRPALTGGGAAWLAGLWLGATLSMVFWMTWRRTLLVDGRPWIWAGPAVAALAFVIVTLRVVRRFDQAPSAGGALGRDYWRLALLWLILYDAGWLFGLGLFWQGGLHLALFVMGYAGLRVPGRMAQLSGGAGGYRVGAGELKIGN